jgi:hypothetical protein
MYFLVVHFIKEAPIAKLAKETTLKVNAFRVVSYD